MHQQGTATAAPLDFSQLASEKDAQLKGSYQRWRHVVDQSSSGVYIMRHGQKNLCAAIIYLSDLSPIVFQGLEQALLCGHNHRKIG